VHGGAPAPPAISPEVPEHRDFEKVEPAGFYASRALPEFVKTSSTEIAKASCGWQPCSKRQRSTERNVSRDPDDNQWLHCGCPHIATQYFGTLAAEEGGIHTINCFRRHVR
jgi:hypothetical protein